MIVAPSAPNVDTDGGALLRRSPWGDRDGEARLGLEGSGLLPSTTLAVRTEPQPLGVLSQETWEWDGQEWLLRSNVGPSPRFKHTCAFDSRRGVFVVFAGATASGFANDVWEWNGDQWRPRVPNGLAPPKVESSAMAYDPSRDVLVVFGGDVDLAAGVQADLWELGANGWSHPQPPNGPPVRSGSSLVFDPTRNGVVLTFGANVADMVLSDTWSWDGVRWLSVAPASTDPAASHTAVFDEVSRQPIVLGGYPLAPNALAVLRLRPASAGWFLEPVSTQSPGAVLGNSMTSLRNGGVLFAGGAFSGRVGFETWRWARGRWQQIVTPSAPPERLLHGASQWQGADEVLLTQGQREVAPFDASVTWLFNRSSWRVIEVGMPRVFDQPALIFFPPTSSAILSGGLAPTSETWALAPEAGWRLLDAGVGPNLASLKSTYDPVRRQLVAVGSSGETWLFDGRWGRLRSR